MKSFAALLALPLALAAPILEVRTGASAVPGEFIVVLKPEATQDDLHYNVESATSMLGGKKPKHSYSFGSFKGYHVSASDELIKDIANFTEVRLVDVLPFGRLTW